MSHSSSDALQTPLYHAHVECGARMVPFAGYLMPVQYPTGILTEHTFTRQSAGLFDVSHMGQALLIPTDGAYETTALALEKLVPADILQLKPQQQRYSQFLNQDGGILDDLMITRLDDPRVRGALYLVVNAACKKQDFDHLQTHLPSNVHLKPLDDFALLALQGPSAAHVLGVHAADISRLPFMTYASLAIAGIPCQVSRSGYTGEDGFEISVPAARVHELWELLLRDERVKPIGLGARDSLRLEAGLCLYGHDIDTSTSPVEAQLTWSIQKRRRLEGGFPGAARIQHELATAPQKMRVGVQLEGRAPAREHALITTPEGAPIGAITSGGFGPTVQAPVAMGYVQRAFADINTPVHVIVRDKPLPAKICALPFVPHRYVR